MKDYAFVESSSTETIERIHTLGPAGTNCEAAAKHWFQSRGLPEQVILHESLEEAVKEVQSPQDALLGCIVYPYLHHIVFRNLDRLELAECFVFDTHSMILAARSKDQVIETLASHPAPIDLVDARNKKVVLVTSNSVAAEYCASGKTDGCITTLVAAASHELEVVKDFGPVPMGFSVHRFKSKPSVPAQ